MDINNGHAVTGTTGSAAPAVASSGALTSDFETFLKLMTTQLQYQDPLKPVDSTEYLSQLASFSTVEQQTRTNKLLESIKTSFDLFGMTQVASWVGSEARAPMPAHVENGAAVPIHPSVATGADTAVLVAHDADGVLRGRVNIPVTAREYQWTPLDISGAPLPDGLYTLTVESYAEGVEIGVTQPELYGRITEVQGLSGDALLILTGGRRIEASTITAMR